jgi:hypothetical protein
MRVMEKIARGRTPHVELCRREPAFLLFSRLMALEPCPYLGKWHRDEPTERSEAANPQRRFVGSRTEIGITLHVFNPEPSVVLAASSTIAVRS